MSKGLFYTDRNFTPLRRRKVMSPVLILDASITFSTAHDQILVHQLDSVTAINFLTTLSQIQTNTKTAEASQNLDIILDESESNVADREASFSSQIDLNQLEDNQADRSVSFSVQIDLNQLENNRADRVEEFIAGLTLDQQQSNLKDVEGVITFTTELDYQTLKQLAGVASITLSAEFTITQLGDATGVVNAAITFLVNAYTDQTNIMTADKAVDITLSAAQDQNVQLDKLEALTLAIQASDNYISTRGVPGSVSFTTELDQVQSNTLDKVLLMSFNALLDKGLGTQGSTWGTVTNFATALAYNFGTTGDANAEIAFVTNLSQGLDYKRFTEASMGFNIDAEIITEIHLIADGQINLSTVMDQTEAIQLLGQSGITFGHIQGLATLNGADKGADISFGTILDYQINGFVATFVITTPDNRICKVHIEDRTTIVDEGNRVIRVRRT